MGRPKCTVCSRGCLGVHRRPISTDIQWLFCVYSTFVWTPNCVNSLTNPFRFFLLNIDRHGRSEYETISTYTIHVLYYNMSVAYRLYFPSVAWGNTLTLYLQWSTTPSCRTAITTLCLRGKHWSTSLLVVCSLSLSLPVHVHVHMNRHTNVHMHSRCTHTCKYTWTQWERYLAWPLIVLKLYYTLSP